MRDPDLSSESRSMSGDEHGDMGGVRICVSLAAPGLDALRTLIAAVAGADAVELRLDALASGLPPSTAALAGLIQASPVPVLATCRPQWEGGVWSGSERDRREVLERALAAGARWIDVELRAPWAQEMLQRCREHVVLSHHRLEPGTDDLAPVLEQLAQARPAIAKLVLAASDPEASLATVQAAATLARAGVAHACFCMGQAARASRLVAAAQGSALTYAMVPGAPSTAAGQWSASYLRQDLRLHRWRPEMSRYGLIGDPIEHSLSPLIFNAAFDRQQHGALYLPLPGRPLSAVLGLASAARLQGLSVTMPYKQLAAQACDSLSPEAERIGAVNTLVRHGAGWHGDNTDGRAVVQALGGPSQVSGCRVAVLGAGGAARAAAVALLQAGAEVWILNRTEARAQQVARELGCRGGPLDDVGKGSWQVLVNATPVGLGSTTRTPVSTGWLQGDETVLDMVYRPLQTRLLREAAVRGCRAVSGLEMFLEQAAAQYRLFTGLQAPKETFRDVAEARLAESRQIATGPQEDT